MIGKTTKTATRDCFQWMLLPVLVCFYTIVLYTNIDQKLMNLLHELLNCEICRLDCHVITTEYQKSFLCIHM